MPQGSPGPSQLPEVRLCLNSFPHLYCIRPRDIQPWLLGLVSSVGCRSMAHKLNGLPAEDYAKARKAGQLGFTLLTLAPVQTSLGPLAGYDGPSHPEHARLVEPDNYADIESGMVLLGMAALEDPPRPEVRDAIEECTLAGIRVGPSPR